MATDPEKAPTYMAQAALGFNEQIECIAEVGVVLLLGGMLMFATIPSEAFWFVPLLLLIIRPIAVYLGLFRSGLQDRQRGLVAWFGVRGVGSIYYLMYAIHHGVPDNLAQQLTLPSVRPFDHSRVKAARTASISIFQSIRKTAKPRCS